MKPKHLKTIYLQEARGPVSFGKKECRHVLQRYPVCWLIFMSDEEEWIDEEAAGERHGPLIRRDSNGKSSFMPNVWLGDWLIDWFWLLHMRELQLALCIAVCILTDSTGRYSSTDSDSWNSDSDGQEMTEREKVLQEKEQLRLADVVLAHVNAQEPLAMEMLAALGSLFLRVSHF